MDDPEMNTCRDEIERTSTIQPTRRFSSQHIRMQPEYQFMKSGFYDDHIRTSIDICAYANRVKTQVNPDDDGTSPQPGTMGRSHAPRTVNSVEANPRPKTAGAIKIVQKVDKIYSTITVIARPKTSVGFCSAPEPERKISNGKKTRKISCGSGKSNTSLNYGPERRRRIYDPAVEKSEKYLHKKNDMFTGANQYLTPARPGLSKLQLHYTDINTTHNDGVIFAHLLQSAHKKNAVIGDGVYGLERRLYTKRADPSKWTTFWDKPDVIRPGSGYRPARSVAQKKKERKANIAEKNDRLGFVPRIRSLSTPTAAEMEDLRYSCRYLRIHPKHQEHLYNTGLVFYGQGQENATPEVDIPP